MGFEVPDGLWHGLESWRTSIPPGGPLALQAAQGREPSLALAQLVQSFAVKTGDPDAWHAFTLSRATGASPAVVGSLPASEVSRCACEFLAIAAVDGHLGAGPPLDALGVWLTKAQQDWTKPYRPSEGALSLESIREMGGLQPMPPRLQHDGNGVYCSPPTSARQRWSQPPSSPGAMQPTDLSSTTSSSAPTDVKWKNDRALSASSTSSSSWTSTPSDNEVPKADIASFISEEPSVPGASPHTSPRKMSMPDDTKTRTGAAGKKPTQTRAPPWWWVLGVVVVLSPCGVLVSGALFGAFFKSAEGGAYADHFWAAAALGATPLGGAPALKEGECPWKSPTPSDIYAQCEDGSTCFVFDPTCCAKHGIAKCPTAYPHMCLHPTACHGRRCCKITPRECSPHGGTRWCPGVPTVGTGGASLALLLKGWTVGLLVLLVRLLSFGGTDVVL